MDSDFKIAAEMAERDPKAAYDMASKVAATPTGFWRSLKKVEAPLEKEMTRLVSRYAPGPMSRASVELKGGKIEVRLWIDLSDGDAPSYGTPVFDPQNSSDAKEIAEILLGHKAKVGSHKAASNVWVAVALFDLT